MAFRRAPSVWNEGINPTGPPETLSTAPVT